jgi:hypothetical protein
MPIDVAVKREMELRTPPTLQAGEALERGSGDLWYYACQRLHAGIFPILFHLAASAGITGQGRRSLGSAMEDGSADERAAQP